MCKKYFALSEGQGSSCNITSFYDFSGWIPAAEPQFALKRQLDSSGSETERGYIHILNIHPCARCLFLFSFFELPPVLNRTAAFAVFIITVPRIFKHITILSAFILRYFELSVLRYLFYYGGPTKGSCGTTIA